MDKFILIASTCVSFWSDGLDGISITFKALLRGPVKKGVLDTRFAKRKLGIASHANIVVKEFIFFARSTANTVISNK